MTPIVSTPITIAQSTLEGVGTSSGTTTLVTPRAAAVFGPILGAMSKSVRSPLKKEIRARIIAPLKKDVESKTLAAVLQTVEKSRALKAAAVGTLAPTPISSPSSAPATPAPVITSVGTITPVAETSSTRVGTAQSRATRADLKETEIGFVLEDGEKPVIEMIISGDLTSQGFPQSNTLFIKRLQSSRVRVRKYSIFRKNVFADLQYKKIKEIEVGQAVVELKYEQLVRDLLHKHPYDYLSFTDIDLIPNAVYAYKLRVDYDLSNPGDKLPTVVVKAATADSPEITRPGGSTVPVSKAGVLIRD